MNVRQWNEGEESEEGLKPVLTDCSTLRCTCKKNNLKGFPACGNCRRSGCINSDRLTNKGGDVDEDDDDDDNDDDDE